MSSRFNRTHFNALALVALCFLPASGLLAADRYILPAAAGTKDGSSWENAQAGTKADFQAGWDALMPGDTLRIGSGTYDGVSVVAGKGGEEGKPVRLLGVDRGEGVPLFTSSFDRKTPAKSGGTFFEAKAGVSNFEIEGIHLKGYKAGIYLRGKHAKLRLAKLEIEEAREGIRSEGGGTPENPEAGTHNVTVSDCRFVKFTKRGLRLEGGNYNWKVERCSADAGGKEWGTEAFHMCFQVANKMLKGTASFEHHIEFADCVAMNSYNESTSGKDTGKSPDKTYWNGDGFCAEAGVHHLRYVRCVSMHNTDGGWDDKSDAPEFISCVSLDNKENFRLWSPNGAAKMTNCLSGFSYKRGGSGPSTGLWTKSSIEGQHCTFIDNGGSQISLDPTKTDARLVFKDSIFFSSATSQAKLGGGSQLQLVDSILCENGDSKTDPGINAKKGSVWENGTHEFESSKYGSAKGFSITRWDK